MSIDRAAGDMLTAEPAKIERTDAVAQAVVRIIEEAIKADEIEIPRLPDLASRILDFAQNPDVSTAEILGVIRTDPVLAGKLIEMANSAAFAGSEPIYNLQQAIVRLGLKKVAEVAFDMSVKLKAFQKEKRHHILSRVWKQTVATGFAGEELARRVPGVKPEEAFLTGIFHDVGGPAIVNAIGKLERQGTEPQGDARVIGLLTHLSTQITEKVVRRWNLPKEARDAIHLQDGKVRERRGKPMAHLLVCAKEVADDLGLGWVRQPVDFDRCRDFKFLQLDDADVVETTRGVVLERMDQVLKG